MSLRAKGTLDLWQDLKVIQQLLVMERFGW